LQAVEIGTNVFSEVQNGPMTITEPNPEPVRKQFRDQVFPERGFYLLNEK
jgi:hypothetical protein